MSDQVGRRLRYYRICEPLQIAALLSSVAYGYLAGSAIPLALAAPLMLLNLTRLKMPEQDCGERLMGGQHEIDRLTKALKNSEEGKELAVKRRTSSHGVKSALGMLEFSKFGFLWLLTPSSYWIQFGLSSDKGSVEEIEIEALHRDVAREKPHRKAEIVGETWHHATKDGLRDYRFKDNYTIPIVREWYAAVHLPTGQTLEFSCRTEADADAIVEQFKRVLRLEPFSPSILDKIGGWVEKGVPPAHAEPSDAPAEAVTAVPSAAEPVVSNPLRPGWQQFGDKSL